MRIFFYETAAGNSPIRKFIDSLPEDDQARFIEVLQEIEEHGLAAVRVVFKQIEGKLWEIKFRSARSGYRVFYIMLESDLMVWLHAFNKKTQRTPLHELDAARKRLRKIIR
jgi:phage-related protein